MCVLKAQKPPQKPSPASASSAPVVKDPLVKKPEGKLKIDTANTFQAFKRTEVKVGGDFSCGDESSADTIFFNPNIKSTSGEKNYNKDVFLIKLKASSNLKNNTAHSLDVAKHQEIFKNHQISDILKPCKLKCVLFV